MLADYFDALDAGRVSAQQWESDRLSLRDWFRELEDEFVETPREAAAARLQQLLEALEDGGSPQQFDQAFLALRRSLSGSDCFFNAELTARVGLIELAGQPALRDLLFYHELLCDLLDDSRLPSLLRPAYEAWEAYLGGAIDAGGKIDPEQIWLHRQEVGQARAILRQYKISAGPTDWPALNAVLNSGDALLPALQWFAAAISPMLNPPDTGGFAVLEASAAVKLEAEGLMALIASLAETESSDLAAFKRGLFEHGVRLKQAYDRLNAARDGAAQTRCIACGQANEGSRNLCSRCGARLPRDTSEAYVGEGITESGGGDQLPETFQTMLDAVDWAKRGDWDPLRASYPDFASAFDAWRAQIEANPLFSTASESLSDQARAVRKEVLKTVNDLDEALAVLEESLHSQSIEPLSEVERALRAAAACLLEVQGQDLTGT